MKLSVSLQFIYLGQSVGLLGRVISSSQETSTYKGQHKHRINVHIHTNIYASSRIRTYDPGIQVSQDNSATMTGYLHCSHSLKYVCRRVNLLMLEQISDVEVDGRILLKSILKKLADTVCWIALNTRYS
jgi:hypothetical protein